MAKLKGNHEWKLNTSNAGKLQEFQRLFSTYQASLKATSLDLPEIDADPITVVAHKASQVEDYILIEDTSLEVEGASVGINVRWMLDHLENYIGKKAIWTVLLAYKVGDEVFVYQGITHGTIVAPRGSKSQSFGFDPVFLPSGRDQTLAEFKPDEINARAKAVDALMEDHTLCIVKAIDDWKGPWQAP